MKKVVLLLIALSVLCVAKPAKKQPKASAEKAVKTEVVEKDETQAAEENAIALETPASDSTGQDESEIMDSTVTIYIHPFNFMVPYSHFWGGVNVPNGFTDYPLYYLTVEWKLMEKISLISMPHYVRVDRKRKSDRYKIHDIGLQESFRLYGVGGKRWRYFQVGFLVDHLHIHSNRDGGFDGWLYGFMLNGGVKKVLNGGEGFLGRFAVFLDVGLGYVWTSDFDADRKDRFFEMDKGLVIDVNAAIGFQI
ncbi:hypothetical protein [Fibrobacter sp. UWB12]|uniref:hypothetical protein n=1 Tax=Fibrobacter sp. UWB12 TaxID=1896203 RepID=UPI000911BCB3|nr:hypothetical protein [Fibrobacter sp. UWB12]SHK67238.1 hypothetical protein SAMN05720759_10551 [Fibrobacter sp. UWB12]